MSANGKQFDEDLHLTKKERELLKVLQGHPGRCFSRNYLLRNIWGYSDGTKTRTVDVHISRLRRKLEQRGEAAIHTVVRKGYMLERLNVPRSVRGGFTVDVQRPRAAGAFG